MAEIITVAVLAIALSLLMVAREKSGAKYTKYRKEINECTLPEKPVIFEWEGWANVFILNISFWVFSALMWPLFCTKFLYIQQIRMYPFTLIGLQIVFVFVLSVLNAVLYVQFFIDYIKWPLAVLYQDKIVLRGKAIAWEEIDSVKIVHAPKGGWVQFNLKGNKRFLSNRVVSFSDRYLKNTDDFCQHVFRFLRKSRGE